jgi:hypothetical protein
LVKLPTIKEQRLQKEVQHTLEKKMVAASVSELQAFQKIVGTTSSHGEDPVTDTATVPDQDTLDLSNRSEDIGIQCELGTEMYYKYAEDKNDCLEDQSIHSSDFSESDISDSDSDILEDHDSKNECDSDAEEFDVGKKDSALPSMELIFVQLTCLLGIFKYCDRCGSSIQNKKIFTRGAVLFVNYTCTEGHSVKWSS